MTLLIAAAGLRNTLGWGWHPDTGELSGMDQGSDWRGNDQPPEDLNNSVEGGNYGWPFCFGDHQVDSYNSQAPQGATVEQYCALTETPALNYQAHSSPMGMVYYTGDQFPAAHRGAAFVAMRGSWNREPVTGYKIVQVQFETGSRSRSTISSPAGSRTTAHPTLAASPGWRSCPMARC